MENTSYALYIAVGVLIGIVVLSIVLFTWKRIGLLESSKDEAVVIKNRADFNAEYEAFNKSLMYGTDVLSCLNKAQNNNQKYVYNNYYGTDTANIGKTDRSEYFMNVKVTLHSTLVDSIRAYYKDTSGKYQRVIGLGDSNDEKNNYDDKIFSGSNRFKDNTVYYYYFKNGKVYQDSNSYTNIMWGTTDRNQTLYQILQTGKIETKVTGNDAGITYNLLELEDTGSGSTTSEITQAAKLSALLTTVGLKEQQLMNTPQPTVFNKTDWWYCTWTTAASDFKSKKFKCTGMEYNTDNGYINCINFEEVK